MWIHFGVDSEAYIHSERKIYLKSIARGWYFDKITEGLDTEAAYRRTQIDTQPLSLEDEIHMTLFYGVIIYHTSLSFILKPQSSCSDTFIHFSYIQLDLMSAPLKLSYVTFLHWKTKKQPDLIYFVDLSIGVIPNSSNHIQIQRNL